MSHKLQLVYSLVFFHLLNIHFLFPVAISRDEFLRNIIRCFSPVVFRWIFIPSNAVVKLISILFFPTSCSKTYSVVFFVASLLVFGFVVVAPTPFSSSVAKASSLTSLTPAPFLLPPRIAVTRSIEVLFGTPPSSIVILSFFSYRNLNLQVYFGRFFYFSSLTSLSPLLNAYSVVL